eukprot:SAG22_NODE_9549_length_583_cov_3.028926_1_plen_52_part_10
MLRYGRLRMLKVKRGRLYMYWMYGYAGYQVHVPDQKKLVLEKEWLCTYSTPS